MKQLIAFLVLLPFHFFISAQQSKYSVELQPFFRYDKANEFLSWTTPTGGGNYVTPAGISYGINANALKQTGKNSNIIIGIGYLNYRISTIHTQNRRGSGDDRLINYPSPLFVQFYSDQYMYHTLSLNLGIEKQFAFGNKYLITTGLGLNGLYTFSQKYHLTTNPEGSQNYRTNNSDLFGLLSGLEIGILREFKKITIGPKIKLPVFTSIKTDATFPNENGSNYRNHWFNAFGLGTSIIFKGGSRKAFK